MKACSLLIMLKLSIANTVYQLVIDCLQHFVKLPPMQINQKRMVQLVAQDQCAYHMLYGQ